MTQIYVEYHKSDGLASTYGQLGLLALDQQQWLQAHNYLLQALEIFASYDADYNASIIMRNLARLWHESGDDSLPGTIAKLFDTPVSEVENWLRQELEESNDGQNKE